MLVTKEEEKREKALNYRSEQRMKDVKFLLYLIGASALGMFIARGVLTYFISGNDVWYFIIPTMLFSDVFIWYFTIKTYIPPGMDFTLVGHLEPENIHSMITIQDFHVPKSLISNINQDALNFPVLRDYGTSNLCDDFTWDPYTGEIIVKPAWGANSELEFITRHEVYHTTREIAKIQARTVNNYQSYMDLEIEKRSNEKAVKMIDRIAASIFEPEDSNRLMENLLKEIEDDKKDLRVKLSGREERAAVPMKDEAVEDAR